MKLSNSSKCLTGLAGIHGSIRGNLWAKVSYFLALRLPSSLLPLCFPLPILLALHARHFQNAGGHKANVNGRDEQDERGQDDDEGEETWKAEGECKPGLNMNTESE